MNKGAKDDVSRRLPRHIAIIMDGNGRWAKARAMPRTLGHRAGMDAVRRAIRAAIEEGVAYLTLFSFSSENWRRSADEVGELMRLLRAYLRSEMGSLHKEGIRLQVIGDRNKLPSDIVSLIDDAERMTKDNTKLSLILALNYGGRQEIANAARRLVEAVQSGSVAKEDIDEQVFGSFLYTAGIPDPDLVVRTSGEERISNFLIWQSAYAEYVFMDVLWPDFSEEHMTQAIDEYSRRDRRFGKEQ